MKASQNAIDLIKKWEGCVLTAYQCAADVWTIGYGHTQGVKAGDTINLTKAEEYLKQDIVEYENYVNTYIDEAKTNQNQFDALVSLCYNIGPGNLRNSWVTKNHNVGDYGSAYNAFMNHVYTLNNPEPLQGLINRREDERKLYAKQVKSEYKYYVKVNKTLNSRFGVHKYLVEFINIAGVYTDENLTKKDKAKDFKVGQTQISYPVGWRGNYFVHAFVSNNGKTYYFAYKRKFN